VRRVAISIPILALSSLFAFLIGVNSGDPLRYLRLNPTIPRAVIAQRAAQLHLNEGFFPRYWLWLSHFVRGDFGTSNEGLPVRHLLWVHMLVTARLVTAAVVLAVVIAVAVGVVSAVRQYSLIDHASTFLSFLLFSLPLFWFAALLKEYVAIRLNNLVGHTFVYTIGDSTPGLTGGFFHNVGNYAGHLLLPTIALAGISYAAYSRFVRASMLDVLNTDYVRLAEAKGLPPAAVIVKHALRNALIPFTTYVAIDIGAILGGTVLTERVFDWQGMGSLLVDAIQKPDLNELLAWLMVTAVIVIVFNLAADLLYGVLDPRVRG
jgi:peptide/nickel transport system permease protein